jgi:hypothetical protein
MSAGRRRDDCKELCPRRAETPAVSRLDKQERTAACAPPRFGVPFFHPVEKNVEQTTLSG